MIVELPRLCSGQEVIDAFKKAFESLKSPGWKWEIEECLGYLQGGLNPTLRIIRTTGVQASLSFLAWRHSFFSKKAWKIWKNSSNPLLILRPVSPQEDYLEVMVDILYRPYPASSPPDARKSLGVLECKPIRAQVSSVFTSFYTQLCFKLFNRDSFASFS